MKNCPHPTIPNNHPKYLAGGNGNRIGKFRTFQRREKFNSLGFFVGTEDVPVIYDAETHKIEELPDTTFNEDGDGYEDAEINVMNENTYEDVEYLGDREDELNLEAYCHKENI